MNLNYHKAAISFADCGFNLVALPEDWQGANCLALHKIDSRILKVQLQNRMVIARKYMGKDVYMCFPTNSVWYFIHHDELLRIVEDTAPNTFKSKSWVENGLYSWPKTPEAIRNRLSDNTLGPCANHSC